MEKSRKSSKERGKKPPLPKQVHTKKNAGGIPAIEEPDAVRESRLGQPETKRVDAQNTSLPGSVISVKDANENAKTDNHEKNESENQESSTRTSSTRPTSASNSKEQPQPTPETASAPKPLSRPSSAASQRPSANYRPLSASSTVHPTNADVQPPANKSVPDFTADSSRPPSAGSRAFLPPEPEQQRPGSGMKVGRRTADPLGSSVSLQSRTSREVWVNNDDNAPDKSKASTGSRPTSAAPRTRPPSAATSVISVSQANTSNRVDEVKKPPLEIVPPDMNEAHAYVPYIYARDCISKMMEDMRLMKRKHITIVNDIEENYQHIEKETQNQFNTFVVTLRQQYGTKVKTFRQVIEVHRDELQQKASHWDEALTSLSNKNKQLLNDKKGLLIQNKIEFDRLNKEKEEALQSSLGASASKDGEIDRLQKENKTLTDQLESEKDEIERLKTELDDLRNRPVTAKSETVTMAIPGGEGEGQVVVTDMSKADRDRMAEERRQMERERADMKKDRAKIEQEREEFSTERTRFTEETVELQTSVSSMRGERDVWRVKHDGLRAQLSDHDDWRKRYEILLAQYQAVTEVAEVNTEEEKQKTEEKINACSGEKVLMEEEKQRLEKETKQFENEFRKQYGRAPTDADRSASAHESFESLEEASHMLNKLTAQISALEALKRGDIPPPPTVEKQVVEIKETEVKTVEIKVPDPELLAHIEMMQSEMDALKQQLGVLKNDKSDLAGERSLLQQQLDEQAAQVAQLTAALEALKNKDPGPSTAAVAPEPVVVASGESEELDRQLKEKIKELRELELKHKGEIRELDKARRGVEKDLKQALRALAKAEKGSSREERRLKDLLAIVAQQVREINGKVNKAAAEVDTRLTGAEDKVKATKDAQNKVKQNYDSWEIGWAEENGREPGVQDVDGDSDGKGLHKALSEANKNVESDEMLVEALTLIKTGAVPEPKPEDVAMEKASPAVQAAQARPVTREGANDAEIEALEQTISDLEKQVQQLEDDVTNNQQERDLFMNENKELEDRHADLLAEIERLKAQIQDLKQREQDLVRQAEEQRIQHDVALREQAREHEVHMEKREEEHKQEKRDMEKDIRKLCKLIDKLKKKLKSKDEMEGTPSSEHEALLRQREQEIDELEDRLAELEEKMADYENDKVQMGQANKKLEEKLETVTTTLTTTETEIAELGAAASAASSAESEARQLRDDLDALRKRIKELEHEVRLKSKEMREQQFSHEKDMREKEREVKDMNNDIEKLVKMIDRLRKRNKELAKERESLLDTNHELVEDVKDRDFEIEWRKNNPEVLPPEKAARPKKKTEEYEEVITELKTKVHTLEGEQEVAVTVTEDFKADYEHVKTLKEELDKRVEELEEELSKARSNIADLSHAAAAQPLLERASKEVDQLRQRLRAVEAEVREREREVKDKDIAMRAARTEHEKELREKEAIDREMRSDMKKLMKQIQKLQKKNKMREGPDLNAVSENDEEVVRLEKALDECEDKLQQLQYQASDLQTENTHLQADKQTLENDCKKLEARVEQLRAELELERERIQQSVRPLSSTSPIPMLASTPDAMGGIDLEDYTHQLDSLQKQVDAAELRLREEKEAHDVTKQELDALKRQLEAMQLERENEKSEALAKQDAIAVKKDVEIDNLNKKITDMRARLESLEQEKIKALPPDTQKEIAALNKRLATKEHECDTKDTERAEMSAKVRELVAKVKSLENSNKTVKTHSTDADIKLKAVKAERDREIKRIQGEADKKERERALQEQKKVAALEQKIRELEYAKSPGGAAKIASTKASVAKGDNKALEDRLREAKRENNDMNARIKQLEKDLKTAGKAGGGASDLTLKKQEKLAQELMKKLDEMTERRKKAEETVAARDNNIKGLEKDGKKKDTEIERLKSELAQLGIAAKAAVESESKRKDMEKELKHLKEENKTLTDSFNSERVLRKKYYNMVEDMKGKIRVYTRVRPMSSSELERGNHSVAKSPDEYTIHIDTARGVKEWQFDQIFMPNSTQERVFEDTNNLIQSAVDGYNVCIFAYGQTGSGKTFTIIGDREQKLPGIAPRAFNRIFELLDENKSKFGYSVSCYMLELYNDKLLDLFAKPGASSDDKLEIKKDKKGMVVVVGSEIKAARNPKELYALFEQGATNRHTASTKMNAESSRSHLVIGIIIETTNKTTGTVMRGKLSLVDLAGSERAAKTGAGAEQLKEAMSINKSLSALGDVISALSSEQSFIPYRNNKLTMLMQDSLGGNAKTLMFVNISPADYNAEESAISLTYASRVKLITNDAQKNSDNKEISRLKSLIAKMKSGQAIEEEVE